MKQRKEAILRLRKAVVGSVVTPGNKTVDVLTYIDDKNQATAAGSFNFVKNL